MNRSTVWRLRAAFTLFVQIAVLGAVTSLPAVAHAKEKWDPVPASELRETKPKVEADAPAEVDDWKINIDDARFPAERIITEYVRFKIFTPDKATNITRLSDIGVNSRYWTTDILEVNARLTLPNGETHEFGSDAIKERTLAQTGYSSGLFGGATTDDTAKEKFLAIPGIEPGAVLEYRIVHRIYAIYIITGFELQKNGIPVRHLELTFEACHEKKHWGFNTYVLRQGDAKVDSDPERGVVTLTATNMPSVVDEPYRGPLSDYRMTFLVSYEAARRGLFRRSSKTPEPGRVDVKTMGPWAGYATIEDWYDRDHGEVTERVKQLAATLTAGAKDDTAKAIAIHEYIRNMYDKVQKLPKAPSGWESLNWRAPKSVDDFLDLEKSPKVVRNALEFRWFTIALYRAAGFEAHTIMLPDRRNIRFLPEYLSLTFLPHYGVAVKVGQEWRFSCPYNAKPLPFGLLPWRQEGQVGLLAQDRKQVFIKVPPTPANASVITSTGAFTVDLAGTLSGDCQRSFTGQTAIDLRDQLRRATDVGRKRIVRRNLNVDPKVVEITAITTDGLDDPEKPLVIGAHLRWPGYASRTKERLIIRPAVLRLNSTTPFPATERHYPICFPYRWKEVDRIAITVPEGFAPEAPTEPPPYDAQILSEKLELGYDAAHHTLHATREFVSDAGDLMVTAYPALQRWYANVEDSDHHEVVFFGRNVPMPEPGADTSDVSDHADNSDSSDAAAPMDNSDDGGDSAQDNPTND